MRRTVIAIVFFWGLMQLWACAAHGGAGRQAQSIVWRTLSAGKAEALERNMPVLVDFYYGPECHRCNMLDREVYADAATVARIIRDFVPVRVDLSKELTAEETELSNVFETKGECLLAFLNAKGDIVTDISGKRICTVDMLSRPEFIEYLDRALARISR